MGANVEFCAVTKTYRQMTYSNEDFERFYIRYKAEAVGRGETMQAYCSRNKVPFNLFLKWYKETRHRVIEIKVDGMPSTSESEPVQSEEITEKGSISENRILVDIKVSNGLYIRRGNMSYVELLKLIKNSEVLC